MSFHQAKKILSKHKKELCRLGVRTLAIFGSVARNKGSTKNDLDVLIDFDRPISLFDLAAVQQFLEQALSGTRVDVVPRDCIYPELESSILSGAIHVL